jgi:RNA polymerase sigma factor (sigma-70 family)
MTATCESQDCAMERLKGLFLNPDPNWAGTWRTLLEDEAFRQELRIRARQTLHAHRAPRFWLEDVEQEAVVVLAEWLHASPTLNADPVRLHATFAAWLGVIVRNACRWAYHRIRDLHFQEDTWRHEYDLAYSDEDDLDRRIDVSLLLPRLDPHTRAVLRLFDQGRPVTEIAESLAMPYQHAYRRLQRGLSQLRGFMEIDQTTDVESHESHRVRNQVPDPDDTRR